MLDETATKLSPHFDNFLLQTIGHFSARPFLEIQIAIDRQFRPELLVNTKLREGHLHGR